MIERLLQSCNIQREQECLDISLQRRLHFYNHLVSASVGDRRLVKTTERLL